MGIDYDAARATALRLISENGVAGVLRRHERDNYDPIADTDDIAVTDYPVSVVFTVLNRSSDTFDWETLLGSYEIDRMAKILIPSEGLAIEPRPGDEILAGGDTWTIKGVSPIRPDGASILHTCAAVR